MDWLKNIGSFIGNMFSGGGGGSQASYVNRAMTNPTNVAHFQKSGMPNFPQMNMQRDSGGSNFLPELMKSFFPGGVAQGIAGVAAPVIGNMFSPKTKTPNFSAPQSVQNLQNFRPGNSISPAYKTMIENSTDRLRKQRKLNLDRVYHSARPGTDYTTDTNYQRDLAEIERSSQAQEADSLAGAEGTFSAQEQARLTDLAQLDIAQIMYETNLSAEEASAFKDLFSNVGNAFLTNATRKPGSEYNQLMEQLSGNNKKQSEFNELMEQFLQGQARQKIMGR